MGSESYFIAKLYRQHKSDVITVPVPVKVDLGLKSGDHVVFIKRPGVNGFEFVKFEPVGAQDGEAKKAQAVIPAAISTRRSTQL
ncbi:hypothetical protein ES705_17293 [subsurface metagenome]